MRFDGVHTSANTRLLQPFATERYGNLDIHPVTYAR